MPPTRFDPLWIIFRKKPHQSIMYKTRNRIMLYVEPTSYGTYFILLFLLWSSRYQDTTHNVSLILPYFLFYTKVFDAFPP